MATVILPEVQMESTNITSAVNHKYRSANNISISPQHHNIYLAIGQDYDSIQDYIRNVEFVNSIRRDDNNNNSNNNNAINDSTTSVTASNSMVSTTTAATTTPIYMFYTDLQELRGLYTPIDYGGGIQYANGLIDVSSVLRGGKTAGPMIQLQMGLWLNGTIGCQDIITGQLMDQIQQLYQYIMIDTAMTVNKVYLRIGYEFDNPTFGYSNEPSTYVQAFQYIVNRCYILYSYIECRNKIDFVWHSWAASLLPPSAVVATTTTTTTTLDDYYPGDEYVDWVGISIFSQLYTETTIPAQVTQLGNSHTVQYVCSFALDRHKPIMIAESTPFGGINQLNDPWQDWFVPILQLIEQYRDTILMWSYIYCNWDTIPMWNHTGFGDSRLEQNDTVLHLWYEQVLNNPKFQNSNFHQNIHHSNINGVPKSITKIKSRGSVAGSMYLEGNDGIAFGSLSGSFEGSFGNDAPYPQYLCGSGVVLSIVLFVATATLFIQRRVTRQRNICIGRNRKHEYEMLPDAERI